MTQSAAIAARRRATLPLYLLASAASLFGNSAISIVLPWLVLARTGDPAAAGLVAGVSALPAAVSALIGGHLADRVSRRALCAFADAGSALSVAGLALVDRTVGLNLAWFVALGVAGALFDVPGMTAREALLADVARSSGVGLDRIAGLRGAIYGLSFLLGPAAAGLLLGLLPPIDVVWVTAACSAVAAVAMLAMPLLPNPAAASPTPDDGPLAGWRVVRRSPVLTSLLLISLVTMMLVPPLLSVLLPAHFRGLARPDLLGVSLSAYALGTVLGSGAYGAVAKVGRRGAWLAANVVFVAGALLIGTLHGFWVVAAGMLLAGVGSGLQQPVVMVILTRAVPDAQRGRVFGLYSATTMLAAPLGLGLITGVVAATGIGAAAWVLAAGWAVVSVWAVASPALRRYLRDTSEEDADADDRPAG